MSEQVGSVTRKKSSDFHGGIRFQSSFAIRWELEDKTFLKIDIINFIPFSNSVTFNLVPRVFSLSNMAAAGEKTLAHSELKRSLIGAFCCAFIRALSLVYSFQNKDG